MRIPCMCRCLITHSVKKMAAHLTCVFKKYTIANILYIISLYVFEPYNGQLSKIKSAFIPKNITIFKSTQFWFIIFSLRWGNNVVVSFVCYYLRTVSQNEETCGWTRIQMSRSTLQLRLYLWCRRNRRTNTFLYRKLNVFCKII